jgi:hypothetical protein
MNCTFWKVLFTVYSRRPRGWLGVTHEKMGIVDQKILSCSRAVKGKLVDGFSLTTHHMMSILRTPKNLGGTTLKIAP